MRTLGELIKFERIKKRINENLEHLKTTDDTENRVMLMLEYNKSIRKDRVYKYLGECFGRYLKARSNRTTKEANDFVRMNLRTMNERKYMNYLQLLSA